MKIIRAIMIAVLSCLLASGAALAEGPKADPEAQITALNMAVVSVRHITAARDRLVLDQEYSQIVNNLSLGDLDDAPEVMGVWTRLLDAISACRLSDEERQVFAGVYEHRQKNALNTVLSGMRPSMGSLRHFFASLFSCGVNAWFGVRRELADIHRAAGEKSWELKKEQLTALHELQKELLAGSWLLLNRHGLPDRLRVTQEDLDCLEQAVAESDWGKSSQMFALIENSFSAFPPYWFYRADAAYRAGDDAAALAFLDRYDAVWKRVLRRDPCRARADRIRILLDESLSDEQTRALVARIRGNTSPRDWLDNLFCGTMLWTLGDRDEAERVVRGNILFNAEREVSTVVLSHMERGDFDRDTFCADLRAALAGEAPQTPEGELLAAWFDGRDGLAVKLASDEYRRSASALPACVLWLTAREPGRASRERAEAWRECFENALSVPSDQDKKALAAAGVRAAQGNARASLLLAAAAEFGWNGLKDPFAAAKYYRAAAEAGSVPAQERFAALCMSGTGTTKNSAEGVRWYQIAAEKGSAAAHYELGRYFRTGQGAARDLAAAASHFFAAAQRGHASAQAALGELYSKGAGVPLDWYEACKWSTAALLGGAENARRTLNIIDGKGMLRKRRLSPEDRDRAAAEGRAIFERGGK